MITINTYKQKNSNPNHLKVAGILERKKKLSTCSMPRSKAWQNAQRIINKRKSRTNKKTTYTKENRQRELELLKIQS